MTNKNKTTSGPMIDRVTFRLNSVDADKLEKMAEETGKTKSDIVKEALGDLFNRRNVLK